MSLKRAVGPFSWNEVNLFVHGDSENFCVGEESEADRVRLANDRMWPETGRRYSFGAFWRPALLAGKNDDATGGGIVCGHYMAAMNFWSLSRLRWHHVHPSRRVYLNLR